MIEYAGIYPKKQSAEYARILNMSNVVHSIRSLYKLQQLSKQAYLEHCQTFKSVLQKGQCLSAGIESETFQGRRGGFCETRAIQ